MNVRLTTKVAGAVAGALLLSTAANAGCGKLVIADMNWASASMIANVDAKILTAMGCDVELVAGATMPTFTSMNEKGTPDVAPELWANAVADLLDSAVDAGRMKIAVEGPITGLGEGWFILPHTLDANPELTSVQAILERPDLFDGKFVGCPAGWGCQLSNQGLFKGFDMASKGWELVDPGSAAGLDGSIAKAAESGQNWFGYYWSPTSIIGKYSMVAVDWGIPYAGDDNWVGCVAVGTAACADPQPSAWIHSRVVTALSENAYRQGQEVMDYFANRIIEGPVLNAELVWMDDNNGTGADAASHFLANSDAWESWVSADVAAAVKAAL
jgi:glycine betaine/proline transport system substrate-binding protein